MTTERPILFQDWGVRAILGGTKTQTRRLVKLPTDAGKVHIDPGETDVFGPGPYLKVERPDDGGPTMHPRIRCPYGYPGDVLWVRETWQAWRQTNVEYDEWEVENDKERVRYSHIEYRATSKSVGPWRPGIHMPRWASRLTLEITEVRIQHLQDISEEDAKAEGVSYMPESGYRGAFCALWNDINDRAGRRWSDDPLVWAISFRKLQ